MDIDCENWEQLQVLFHLVEETPDADRDRVLAEACLDDAVRQRVLAILAASEHQPEAVMTPEPALSGRFGAWSLLNHLGTGGLGAVYLAERSAGGALQRGALKVIAPHAGGAAFVERFYREQQILASLDHPHITRMLDAGVSDTGQPYLVMEYVDGVHLDRFCDDRQLGIEERLRLFLQVCEAVAYAHRNLVVHLDLKPSNILATKEGQAKLLDFGTSKVIEADRSLTSTVFATPAYASPEQLLNQPVTTACDIYALGAVLFELLCGRRPGEDTSVALLIERAVREQEPERIETVVTEDAAKRRGLSDDRLRAALRGDLSIIVSKCLRPQPLDRYLSLETLMDDLRRYLAGRPVLARPQTTWYRAGKFVRRNRAAVTAAGLLLALLAASLGYAGWQQERALEEARRAVRMQDFLYKLFRLANSNYTGKPSATVPEFLQLGVRMLPQYISDPRDLREAQMSLAESMFENEDLADAKPVFEQTVRSAHAAADLNAEAESEAFLGHIAYLQGDKGAGERLTADALKISQKSGISPSVRVWSAMYFAWNRDNLGFRTDENLRLLRFAVKESVDKGLPPHQTADAMFDLAEDLEIRGYLDESETLFRRGLDIYGDDPSALCDRSQILGELANVQFLRNDIAGSVPTYKQAWDGATACSGPQSRKALTQQESYIDAIARVGRAEEARTMMLASMPAWRKLEGKNPDLGEPLYFLAQVNMDTGRFAEAAANVEEAVAVATGKIKPTDRRFGVLHLIWARALASENHWADALPHARLAANLLSDALSPSAKKTDAEAHQVLLDIQSQLGGNGSAAARDRDCSNVRRIEL